VTLGAHSYNVVVTSSTGNTASMLVTYLVNANNAPAVLITAPAAGSAVSGSVTITATTNGGAPTGAASYQIDGGGSWVGIATAWVTTGLANGSHTIQVEDSVNSVMGYSGTITVVVNNGNAPTFSLTAPAPGSTIAYTTTVTANYSGTYDSGSVQYSVDGGAWIAAGDTTQSGIPVQVGTNTLQLMATNTVGGVATTGYSAIDTFTVASGAPVIGNILLSNITSTTATINWTTNVLSTGNAVNYGLDYSLSSPPQLSSSDGVTAPQSHSASLSGLTPGSTYYFSITSTAGGSTSTSGVYAFITASDTDIVVNHIDMLQSYATADGTYTDGWEFAFHITINDPLDTTLQMKFDDWSGTGGTIPAIGNMKIALDNNVAGVQAGTDGVAVGNNYSDETTALTLPTSGSPTSGGRQVTVYVYIQVPTGTSGGSYSTSYGIHTAH
jgi:hypothetical protein